MAVLITLACLVVLSLFSGLFVKRPGKALRITTGITTSGLVAALAAGLVDWGKPIRTFYNDMLVVDNYTIAFSSLAIFTGICFVILKASNREKGLDIPKPEMIALLVATVFGAYVMIAHYNLVMLFLGIEILSIALYILVGAKRKDAKGNEASMKYFLMGAFATGFLLFGIALVYGASGSFHLAEIADFVQNSSGENHDLLLPGILLILFGMAFKIAAVPFHFWAPDVYEGAPVPITGFMATLVKTAGIAAFFRLFFESFELLATDWSTVMSIIAIATMLVGNILAVAQTSLKRMMAYSGIGHAGYLLMALVSLNQNSDNALLYYTAAYTLATVVAFAVLMLVQQRTGNDDIRSFNGLGKRNPFAAFAMAFALFSMAGIPPTAGFWAKYYIFFTAFESGYIWLVIIAIATSCIGIYYYFKVIAAMYFSEGVELLPTKNKPVRFVMLLCFLLLVVLSIFPGLVMGLL